MTSPTLAFVCVAALCVPLVPAHAQTVDLGGLTWVEQKCVLYQSAWDWAVNSVGAEQISANFIADNDRFVASGCLADIAVCPTNDAEFELANLLTVMTMNEGMASTFVPFACP
ncbi:hypothetical protein [Gymnodinialimonas sp. 57CJ19]|uniref:hypothetical protein n=1 Tax=Gymnodinialimonas sp. 57CJ19 TaxID=3138498 RepID=UPI0031342B50